MIEAACFAMTVRCDGAQHGIERYTEETQDAPQNETEANLELKQQGWVFLKDGRTFHSKKCFEEHKRLMLGG